MPRLRQLIVVGLAAALSTLGGCAGPHEDRTSWPRSNTDLVLQLRKSISLQQTGTAGAFPDFSLYGDGRAVRGGTPLPTTTRLDRETVGDLLRDASRLADEHQTGTADPDAPVIELTYIADSDMHTVRVPGTDNDIRELLRRALEAGAHVTPYSPTAVAVLATSGAGGSPLPWPLGRLDGGSAVHGSYCRLLRGDRARRALHLATAAPTTTWVSGGVAYAVKLRPLLPDEHSCSDLE